MADAGDPIGMRRHARNLIGERDYFNAFSVLQKGAEIGDPKCMKMLSDLYNFIAPRILRDRVEGFKWDLLSEYFWPIWEDLVEELESLLDNWPNWTSIEDLDKLCEIIIKSWNTLGIFPKVEKDDLLKDGYYVDVPFS